MDFTHFNDSGHARMVNVGGKEITQRKAVASGRIHVNAETFRLIKTGGMKKGDVFTTAQIAGIMAAKKTPDIIPMCHTINLNGVDISFRLDEANLLIEVTAEISCSGRTGVEMEALTAVSAALLTVYDMCKAVQKDMTITDIKLESKSGGIHGDYERSSSNNGKR